MSLRCDSAHPISIVAAGPSGRGVAARAMLAMTSLNPCGAEVHQTLLETEIPMKTLTTINVCVPGCVGDWGILDSSVLHIERSTPASGIVEPTPGEPCQGGPLGQGVTYSFLRLKLRIEHCAMPEPVFVDVGSRIALPAGTAVVSLIGPGDGGVAVPIWTTRTQRGVTPGQSMDHVLVRISVCPCGGCPPPQCAMLTHYVRLAAAGIDSVIILRPRRACSLEVSPAIAAAITVSYLQDTSAALALGSNTFNGANAIDFVRLIGATPALLVSTTAADVVGYIRWGIA